MTTNRVLLAYSGALTLAMVASLLTGAASQRNASFDTVDVRRINVREADGTVRLVLTSSAASPGVIVRGRERPHPRGRKAAGLFFYNEEGTEAGGLTFGGRRDARGAGKSELSLSFDRYEQDQQLQLLGIDADGRHFAGLKISDVPSRPITDDIAELERITAMAPDEAKARIAQLKSSHHFGADRLFVGKTPDQISVVALADANGRPRLQLQVAPSGEASLQFLDIEGRVTAVVSPESLARQQK